MKKIIAITAMAAAVAGFTFADEPVANVEFGELSGNASVTWGVDLDDGGTGFKNEAGGKFVINIAKGGSKSTEGDGIWGDIEIKADGDLVYKDEGLDDNPGDWDGGKVKLDHAKLHFGPVYVGITDGNTQVGDYKVTNAIMSADNGNALQIGAVPADSNPWGIVAGYGDDNFGVDVDFRSSDADGDYYTNDYGMAVEAKLKDSNAFVKGLFVDVGYAYDFGGDMGLGVNAGYKLGIGEKFYLRPEVAYNMVFGGEMNLVGGVVFGWGDTADANAGVPYLDGDYAKKVTPGVGVAVKLADLGGANTLTIVPSFYSGDLIPNLTVGAVAEITPGTTLNLGVAGGAKYTIAVGDSIKISPYAGARFITGDPVTAVFDAVNGDNGGKDDVQVVTDGDSILNVKAGCEFTGLISNTTFNVWYQSRNLLNQTDYTAAPANKAVLGTVNVSCKIAL